MPRFNGRFIKADDPRVGGALIIPDEGQKNEGGESEKGQGIGVHLLAVASVAAILVIFFLIPEFSYKPTERLRLEDLDPDALVLVPNRAVRLNTRVRRTNRITGDRTTIRCQDAAQDDVVLAPRHAVQGDFTVMIQGDAVPIHAELLDVAGWLRKHDCERKCEELGYLVAV